MTPRPLVWKAATPDLAFALDVPRRTRRWWQSGFLGRGSLPSRTSGSAGGHSSGHHSAWVWTLVAALASTMATAGCGTAGPSGPAVEQALAARPEAMIQLRSEGCQSGRCPVYSLAVYVDGSTVYRGGANVTPIGQQWSKISNADVAALISTVEKMDFIDMPEHCCDCADAHADPGAAKLALDYRPGGVEKEIMVDAGCSTVPDDVRRLVRQIQADVGVAMLTSPPTLRADAGPTR